MSQVAGIDRNLEKNSLFEKETADLLLKDNTGLTVLEYAVSSWLTLGAYVAYYDYLFDEKMREAAAAYNGEWGARYDQSWNVVGGLSVTATF